MLNCFLTYRWPGNVRELRALVQSLATMSEEETITMQDLPQYMQAQSPLPQGSVSFRQPMREAVAELERNMIMTALTETGSTYKAAPAAQSQPVHHRQESATVPRSASWKSPHK